MFKLMFLGLLACASGQLIYPDEFEMLKSSIQPLQVANIPQSRPPVNAVPNNNAVYYSTPLPIPTSFPSGRPTFTTPQQFPPGASRAPQQFPVGTTRPPQRFPVAASRPAQAAAPENPLQDWDEHVNNIIVRGLIKFSLDIEREIHRTRGTSMFDQQDNIVFSPISLSVALALVLAGSAGRTFNEVSRVLGLESGVDISRNSEIVHQMFGILLDQLHNNLANSAGPRLDFATAAFVQNDYPILQEFKSISQDVYGNEVIDVDFARKGRSVQQMINAWVKQKTMGKIDSILNDVPSPDTTLILLSALYFNGEWNQHFLQGATKRRQFFIEPDRAINVDMMYNGGQFPFYEDKQLGVKIIGLPYKGQETSMYVLLPNARGAKALRDFLSKLKVENIESLIDNMKNETCIVGLPKMKLSSSLSLKSTLANLGLTSLFDPATADLSLISQGAISPRTASDPRRTTQMPSRQTNGVTIGPRVGVDNMVRRNFFEYEDKNRGYTVEQWSTGFSIRKSRKPRESETTRRSKVAGGSDLKEDKDVYRVEGSDPAGDAKVVSLEANRYRFLTAQRARRQSRPINEDFLDFIKQRNFPSYGLDDLRNSANLVNPHIFASDVLHKVEIDITETGTEAAAVTGVILERDGSQKRLLANRPFLFIIRNDRTGLILFWGTVNSPTPNYSVT
nr:serpin B4-like [Megalopta genalis]XP_033329585.1 serpin B4-like [Megalopta genalis]